jgi:hypothetical protein
MRFVLSLLLVSAFFSNPALAKEPENCESQVSAKAGFGRRISEKVEKNLERMGVPSREARGYSILIATMVASAVAANYASSSLPPNLQFISYFLSQISTLGVFVFGAPIWEPLSSGFRKMAFGVKKSDAERDEKSLDARRFDELWRRTQETYSLNEQMSRNLVTQFIVSVHRNFYEAYRAVNERNPIYAADQLAEAAFRLRTMFRDISPEDPSVAAAVKTAFVNHVQVDPEFVEQVRKQVAVLDKDAETKTAKAYYDRIYLSWLGVAAVQ